jgi:putative endopeptidase
MNRKDRDAKGIAQELKNIDAIANYSDLAAYFGKSNRTGVSMPFSVVVTEDFKTKQYTMTWGGLGLPEREYYLQPMPKW